MSRIDWHTAIDVVLVAWILVWLLALALEAFT